ncbi:uncharacterized protein TRIREDRAFT_107595 [Trichoderma reesei QM6a]|uniref:Predicted protein n=2 Tax=Hypocrea jecorina TaxID=51453 RepID=G0RJ52_HYPJQ|nr:uncharacterized protein TRIREDRAFT_107595 [Trichoderma reesei QM6a]EGR48843.1 predicted protein [Trichoderma reesei QM6a]ETR97257.1 hypothetical protein M419DRAFT_92002 [Trichoderma reesei RUT C-30]
MAPAHSPCCNKSQPLRGPSQALTDDTLLGWPPRVPPLSGTCVVAARENLEVFDNGTLGGIRSSSNRYGAVLVPQVHRNVAGDLRNASCEQSPHGAPQRATRDNFAHSLSADVKPEKGPELAWLGCTHYIESLSIRVSVLGRTRFQVECTVMNQNSNPGGTHLEGRAYVHSSAVAQHTWAGTNCTACCSALWQHRSAFNGTQASGLVRCPTTPGAAAGRQAGSRGSSAPASRHY